MLEIKTDLLTLKEAAEFASQYINKHVTTSNISYLVNYGRIPKAENSETVLIDKQELIKYYEGYYGSWELDWKTKLGNDLNWALSFEHLKEAETTKHVHRLHPYKGKFIPQLVEYFLDDHIDELKTQAFFKKGDIVLHPLVAKHNLKIKQKQQNTFLGKWYLQPVRSEIDFVFEQIKKVQNSHTKKVLTVILSRIIRSCRATTHADLATLVEPVTTTYYCAKHGKICKSLFSIVSWWERYCKDTIQRFAEFSKLRTNTFQYCLHGNSQTIDIFIELEKKYPAFHELVQKKKIKGIFSSPPYVGLIDYHEQHAYAYDWFGFERKDEQEIGSMSKKQSKQSQQDYVKGIANALSNCKRFLANDYDIFLIANDKYNLYQKIAEIAGMQIVNHYKRPVLNRIEKDKGAYSEIIFHLKNM